MARVTVEDCVDKIPNRFELVIMAAHRARSITSGSQITVDRDNDKNPVVALREIAAQKMKPEGLREEFLLSLQRHIETDEPEAEKAAMAETADAPFSGPDWIFELKLDGYRMLAETGAAVEKGQPLFTVHAEASGELDYAMDYITSQEDIITIRQAG